MWGARTIQPCTWQSCMDAQEVLHCLLAGLLSFAHPTDTVFGPYSFLFTIQQLVSLVQTMKLCWTWQPTALVSLHKGAGSCDPHQSFPRHGCGLLFTWYNCQAYCDPSWREPWSSFPWLQGGGCLSSPRPSNGSLGWLRGCHQLLEFLDSNPNSPSQRDWLLVSWVSDLWDSWILQLGRFS